MRSSTDPSLHRQREQQFMQHVERLLDDPRLRLDTTAGRRAVPTLGRRISKRDREVELIRTMAEMGRPDRELQAKMPVGQALGVTLWRKRWFVFTQNIGQLMVVCTSPTRALIAGSSPQPMDTADLRRLSEEAARDGGAQNGPLTLVVMSTSGFTLDAHELAERRADRTVILAEPNDAGGWTLTGPTQTQELVSLFDPETEAEKRSRVRRQIEAVRTDLLTGSLGADRIAGATQLPLELVESEVKSYAAQNPGLVAKRLDGRLTLFRESSGNGAGAGRNGDSDMPFLQRLKAMFFGKDDGRAKVAALAEGRARLTQQRDAAYGEIELLEKKEGELKQQFKDAPSELAKRRITGQMLQLRKDMERRQQILGMLNQQINVISTQLHNIELVQQGQAAQLPSSEELADNAAEAEKILADLQVSDELAGTLGATAGGMSTEEQALYEELQRESKTEPVPAQKAAAEEPVKERAATTPTVTEVDRAPANPPRKLPGEAEAG